MAILNGILVLNAAMIHRNCKFYSLSPENLPAQQDLENTCVGLQSTKINILCGCSVF